MVVSQPTLIPKNYLDHGLIDNGANGPTLSVELVTVCKLRIHHLYIIILERYRVLWDEWKVGIASRRTCGEVDAKGWDGSGPESVCWVFG